MTGRWSIDIGAAPTQTDTIITDRIGVAPTPTDKMMTDRIGAVPKTELT